MENKFTSRKHIMRPIFLILLLIAFTHSATAQIQMNQGQPGSDTTLRMIPARWEHIPIERPGRWVNDLEKVLTNQEEKYLDSLLLTLYKKTTIELFLVTIDTAMSRKEMFNDLGLYIMQNWFAGADSNSYGGIVLISKGLKKIKVFSNEKLSQFISDAEMKAVIEQGYMPGFRRGAFYDGAKEGTTMLTITLRKNYKSWGDSNVGK